MNSSNDRLFFTFDLFDTLITRTVLSPEDLFVGVGSRLRGSGLWSKSAAQFQKLRVAADGRTRRTLRIEEITLDQIYQTMAAGVGWSSEEAKKAQGIEIEEELAAVRPIAEMCARWAAIDPARKAIVSDTYFSVEVIEGMLDRCDVQCDRERLFLSSVYCKRKSAGQLFRLVASSLGVPASQIHHVGDNARSDLASARNEGLSAELYEGSAPRRYDRAMKDLDAEGGSRIAGALRCARLAFPGGTETERTLWEIGSMVAGPILFSYVAWVIAKAKQEDLQHLYFLARDGQILLHLARKIDPAFPSSYLLASRQAWHLPSIVNDIDEKSLSWIADAHAISSLRNVLNRVGIEPEEMLTHGFPASVWELPVRARTRIDSLFADESLRALVFRRALEARERVQYYLENSGVLAVDRIGLVDLGWNGRLQRSLSRLLKESPGNDRRRMHGFYFSLRRANREKESGQFHSYSDSGFAKRRAHAMLMELFCSADHGGLLRFAWNEEGSVDPVLVDEEDGAVIAWGLRVLHSAILAAAENLLSAGREMELTAADVAVLLREPAAKALDLIADRPTRGEAEAFGRFPFTYDQYHAEVFEMGPAFPAGHALAMFLPATVRAKGRTMWMQATLVRSLGRSTPLALQLFRWRDTLVRSLQRSP
jgi:predicted HAD superfamily hydrolase